MASSKSTTLPSLWSSFKQSFYSPGFYKQVPSFPFGKVMGYLLLIVTLGYLVFLGKSAIMLYQNRDEIQQGIDKILNSYPENLELTFKDGQLTSNVEEPYFFPSEGIKKALDEKSITVNGEDAPEYFVVIDTKTPFSLEQFKTYDSMVWLGKDTAYILKNGDEMQSYPYGNELNQVVNRQTVNDTVNLVFAKIKTPLIIGGSILLVLADFGLFLYFFAYLAFAALLYFFFSHFAGIKHEYPDCYRIAVYAVTPAWILSLFIQILSLVVPFGMPPFLFTAVLLLTVYFNVHHLGKQSSTQS